jgi:hypothetical protein
LRRVNAPLESTARTGSAAIRFPTCLCSANARANSREVREGK